MLKMKYLVLNWTSCSTENDYIYWADSDHGTVTRIHRDGTGRQVVVEHFETMESVPVDWLTGNVLSIYYQLNGGKGYFKYEKIFFLYHIVSSSKCKIETILYQNSKKKITNIKVWLILKVNYTVQ